MRVKYGNFLFEPWEAGIAINAQAVNSPSGFRKTLMVRVDIEGEVCTTDQYAVTARLDQIYAAMVNYQDLSLLHDDNSPAHHVLLSNHVDNLSGNQVRQISYPQTVGNEYANGRKFRYVVEAELAAPESQIIEWVDHIQLVGNAGPQYRWVTNPQWGSYPELVSLSSPQRVEHIGYAIGMGVRLAPAVPYYTPPFEQNHLREVGFTLGKRHPQGYSEQKTTWHYRYILPVANDLLRPSYPTGIVIP